MLRFEQSIQSKYTLRNYKSQIERFLKFTKLKDYDSLVNVPKEDIQMLVEEYAVHLTNTINANSVQTMMTGVKHFFIMNKIPLYWEFIQKMYPKKVKRSGFLPWTTEHIRKMLNATTSERTKAIIHFMASTGSRVGIHDYDLSMKHLKNLEDDCKAVLIYAGEIDEYWAFLTPEASEALELYFSKRQSDGEIFSEDSPIFRIEYNDLGFGKAKPVKKSSVACLIWRIIKKKAGIDRKRINRNFDIQQDHGFRKRFNTIMKLNSEINSNIAEKILGHSVSIPMDNTYLTPNIDNLFKEFKKGIPELTISETYRLRLENESKEKEIQELQSDKKRIAELELKMENVKELLKRVTLS